MSQFVAALTGDLVDSSRMSSERLGQARRIIASAVDHVASWDADLVPAALGQFRGDAWQCIVARPELSLRAALYVRAALREAEAGDTRIAIGIGPVESIDRHNASLSTGRALTLSGKTLDQLPHWSRMSVALDDGVPASTASLVGALVQLCGALADQWYRRQAGAVRWALLPEGLSQAAIGARLNPRISHQAVSKSLDGARWQALEAGLRSFEAVEWGA